MLEYVKKLTLTPGAMERAGVERLLAAGFSEQDVLVINQVAGYYAYVNRLADGLGVPLEPFWDDRPDRRIDPPWNDVATEPGG